MYYYKVIFVCSNKSSRNLECIRMKPMKSVFGGVTQSDLSSHESFTLEELDAPRRSRPTTTYFANTSIYSPKFSRKTPRKVGTFCKRKFVD